MSVSLKYVSSVQSLMMNDVVLINKPKGWTSFDVVAKIRGQIRAEYTKRGIKPTKRQLKVGHAGTLDPLATGLLVVLVGEATKRQDTFMKQDKIYHVTVRLGETSATGDAEGEKIFISSDEPSLEQINTVLEQFIGKQEQTPPAFSAIKVNGQRAYKLARNGQDVKLSPREVIVYSITKVKYSYPNLSFVTKVSSGTYIRSLVADIGTKLNTGAYMSDLERQSIGQFELSKAYKIGDIEQIDFDINN